MAEDRLKELDSYFGIHCELPAGMIRDLFDVAFRTRAEIVECRKAVLKYGDHLYECSVGQPDGVCDCGFQKWNETTKDSAP